MSNYRTIEIARLSGMFGALSNPNRLTLFLRLLDCCGGGGSCSTEADMGTCVADLSQGIGIAPSTVSHHLKELRRSGLISMGRRGRRVECAINLEAVAEITRLLGVENLTLSETTG
jgi:DNA-binding transcriptional ArsR family regulator